MCLGAESYQRALDRLATRRHPCWNLAIAAPMPPILLALLFGLVAAYDLGAMGFLLGGLGGYCLGAILQLRRDMAVLRQSAAPDSMTATPVPPASPVTPLPPEPVTAASASAREGAPERPLSRPTVQTQPVIEKLIRAVYEAVRGFFTTGNLVARIGVIVLFFGIAFLLRYTYERDLVPIELRLLGAAALGICLTIVGWRFRHRTDTFGVVLQGAGVGVLYLTIFGAARMYELLPVSAAFTLMIVLVAASSLLAVLQNAQALAIFAMSGGFLAPVLMSTGGGSHIALFSYYALLNAGILAMAWFKSWRWLNWVGFVFTFVIGAAWGYRYYRPEYFATVEPFLILSFAYYVGVTILFGRRAAPQLRGLVDGTLVFGTPIVAFGLQAAMVRDIEFGLAYSALTVAIVYIALARWLRARGAFTALLGQSFLALGVVFATLTLPFAFDDQRFTAASWALEGAGLVWVGFRQRQWLPRAFGGLLALAGGVAFFYSGLFGSSADSFLLNSTYLGTVMLAVGGAFTAYLCAHHVQSLHRYERPVGALFLFWAALWWFGGGTHEISSFEPWWYERFSPHRVNDHLELAFVAGSVALIVWLARWRAWPQVRAVGFILVPAAYLAVFAHLFFAVADSPLVDLGFIAWPGVLAAALWHLRETQQLPRVRNVWHAALWWLTSILLAWAVADAVGNALPGSVWYEVIWGIVPTAALVALLRARNFDRWPFTTHGESYFGLGVLPMAAFLCTWLLIVGTGAGDPAPLSYVVLLNPLELTQLAAGIAVAYWIVTVTGVLQGMKQLLGGAMALVAFAWLNLTAARAVHHYADVAYPLEQIVRVPVYQTTIAIVWTATALLLMASGARRGIRAPWIAGAVLLGLVILKLFTIDLSNLDVVARIVSFMSVGVLMLLIGYLAPIPPVRRAATVEAP